jgi:GT2 family glycosyltransferase
MIDLTVIIVNYNVRHFLEQCLLSVLKASARLQVEVIVVDNNSQDGSQEMLREKFAGQVTLIENQDNPGFSKANNQGIAIARGKYALLLNPDTIVEEETFDKCYAFMESHPRAGALGVKMLDGQGNFLPESKRSLPTPWVSFFKIFGLARLFPKNKTFGRYHLSYLDKEETHEVEVLSGAFMWMRKEVLDKIGGLDETFFMYGEDIDLSYRVLLAGYQNYYFADTRIIHYKGESTKKGSLNYVRVFYQAMIIFAKKHFGGSKKQLFILLIYLAVYFRAALAIGNRLIQRFGFPLLELGLSYGIIYGIKEYWEHYVKYVEGGQYPLTFDTIAAPTYALVFISLLGLAGAYKKPFRIPPIINATFGGFVAIATVSYLFPEINFSRAIVGLSSVFTMIMALSTRGLITLRENGRFFFTESKKKQGVLLGKAENMARLEQLIHTEIGYPVDIVGILCEKEVENLPAGLDRLGSIAQLPEINRYYKLDEVIFDNEGLPTDRIIGLMNRLSDQELSFKIVPPGAAYLVGPQAIYTSRYHQQVDYNLQKPPLRWRKNLLDVLGSISLLLSFPLLFWAYQKPSRALGNLLRVLLRQKHLIGYIHPEANDLPPLKPGLLNMLSRSSHSSEKPLNPRSLDHFYARTYSWALDLEILLKGWRGL